MNASIKIFYSTFFSLSLLATGLLQAKSQQPESPQGLNSIVSPSWSENHFAANPIRTVSQDHVRVSTGQRATESRREGESGSLRLPQIPEASLSGKLDQFSAHEKSKTPSPASFNTHSQSLRFTENKGQIADTDGNPRPDVLFTAGSSGVQLYFRRDGVSYVFAKHETIAVGATDRKNPLDTAGQKTETKTTLYRMDMELVGANFTSKVRAEGAGSDYTNYYYAHCPDGVTYVRSYETLMYEEIYDNIDLVFYEKDGSLKYDFVLRPGARVDDIRLRYSGNEKMDVTQEGKLRVTTPLGNIEEGVPYSFVTEKYWRRSHQSSTDSTVDVRYQLTKDEIGFEVGEYDLTKTLVIDPTIQWASFYGGSDRDEFWEISTDQNNNIIVVGATTSVNGISTNTGHQVMLNGGWDGMIVKFNPGGSRIWGTYYGGNNDDRCSDVDCDSYGDIAVVGSTASTTGIATLGSHQNQYGGGTFDAFVLKLSAGGIRQWATYYGGSGEELHSNLGISVSTYDEVAIIGSTKSSTNIATPGSFQENRNGGRDVFIVKFDAQGARMWGTYFGGSNDENGNAIKFDSQNNVVGAGYTNSTSQIASINAFQTNHGGLLDAFIIKLSSSGSRLWSTYYGGSGDDYGDGIATDPTNSIFLTGDTFSTNSIATIGSHQQTYGGGSTDAFLIKFDASGNRIWGTYYGGGNRDLGFDVFADQNNVLLSGLSSSTNGISTGNAFQQTNNGMYDAIIVRFDQGGTRQWGSYHGGSILEWGYGVDVSNAGEICVVGYTESSDCPSTNGAHQTSYGGSGDGIILKISSDCSLTCPSNITTTNDANQCGAVVSYTAPGTQGTCGTVTCTPASGSFFPVGTTTVTCNASGGGSCSFTVTVNDTQGPTLTCSSNIIVDNTAGQCSTVVSYTTPTATDNCSCTVPQSITNFTNLGTYNNHTYFLSNYAATWSTANATATSLGGHLVSITSAGENSLVANSFSGRIWIGFNDLANEGTFVWTSGEPVSYTNWNSGEPNGGTAENMAVTNWTGVSSGNWNDWADNNQNNFIVEFDCNPITVTLLSGLPSGSSFPVGTTTVTWQATDANNNSSTCSFTVTVNDTETPTIVCPSNIVENTDEGQCSKANVTYVATASDNCPGVTVACSPASGSTFLKGVTTVTCTATDASNNVTPCTFTVTINDAELPTIVCPSNMTVVENPPGSGGATVTFSAPTVTDNCPNVGSPICTPASGSTFPLGTTTVNCSVADAENNSASCSFTVTVNAASLTCTITCPSNQIVGSDANQCGAVVNYPAPTVTGTCGTVSCTPPAGSFFAVGTTTVTCIAQAGNQCSFTVTVNDTEAPFVTCPSNITASTDAGQCSRSNVTYTATAIDNCPGVTVGCNPTSGSTFPKGTTTVTCTATDASNNTASCTFTVTINDTEAPFVTCPSNITASTDAGQCSRANVTYTATPMDNCPGVTVVCNPPSGSTFPKGTTTVTCTATDVSNNTASCTFTVTINDTEAPFVTCPSNITANTDAGQCSRANVTYTATPMDNCPGVTVVCNPPSGSTFPKGTTTVTCTATDASNNTASCTFSVTINDTQPPSVSCPNNITTTTSPNVCYAVVTFTATATDNCSGVTVACTPPSGSQFSKGVTTVTCTATDASSNTASCSFTVTVNDTQAPSITCPSNITKNTDPNVCTAVATWTAPTVSDNCPGVGAPVCSPSSGSTFQKGTTTISCTVSDASGNSAACSFSVTVIDAQPPTITCPANIAVESDATCNGATVTFAPTNVTDNCPGVTYSCSPPSGSYFASGNPIGVTTVTCTAIDASNNTATCTFTVSVEKRPIISPGMNTLTFAFGCKIKSPVTKQIQINNSGGRFGGGVLAWTASTTASEITILNPNGTEGQYLQLKVNPGSLTNGTYTRTVTITGRNSVTNSVACNSPLTLTIIITIEPDQYVTQTKAVGTNWTQFTNSVGQTYAEVKSNSGTINSFTVECWPCRYPWNGLGRYRYVKRTYKFSSTNTSFNYDLKLNWNEAELQSVTNPSMIQVFQQPTVGGTWFNRGGTADVSTNTVTTTSLTSIAGYFGEATPWTPKKLSINVLMARYERETRRSIMRFTTQVIPNEEGFYIERSASLDEESWEPVGQIPYDPSHHYDFSEQIPEASAYYYRVFTLGSDGLPYESNPFMIQANASMMQFALEQNYPNPFNPTTSISYQIAEAGKVLLKVFDVHMREVAILVNEEQNAGRYSVKFDATDLSSGVYFYRLESGAFQQTKRMTLMK